MSINDEEREFWDSLILNPDGTVNMDAVYDELSDYRQMMYHTSRVYYDITCGMISKPNTHSSDVLSQSSECNEKIIRDEIFYVLEQLKRKEMTLDEALEEYADDD